MRRKAEQGGKGKPPSEKTERGMNGSNAIKLKAFISGLQEGLAGRESRQE